MDPSLSHRADQAAHRAAECSRRIERLRRRAPFTAGDLQHAQTALDRARARSAFALVRATLVAAHGASQPELINTVQTRPDRFWEAFGGGEEAAIAPEDCAERVRSGAGSLANLYAAYVLLGGACKLVEVDAYVHGALRLPRIDRAMIEHALWELANF